MSAVHVTVWDEAGAGAPTAVLIHGSMTWGAAAFERQRSLASFCRLVVVDRRGYGSSPDVDRSDYDADAEDVLELLGDGEAAHVVGHSSGGVVAMLLSGRRPRAVRSLALIEPAAFRVTADDPSVASALERLREAVVRRQNLVRSEIGDPEVHVRPRLAAAHDCIGLGPPAPGPRAREPAVTPSTGCADSSHSNAAAYSHAGLGQAAVDPGSSVLPAGVSI